MRCIYKNTIRWITTPSIAFSLLQFIERIHKHNKLLKLCNKLYIFKFGRCSNQSELFCGRSKCAFVFVEENISVCLRHSFYFIYIPKYSNCRFLSVPFAMLNDCHRLRYTAPSIGAMI